MDSHCNVCGRETNSAGNCPVNHYITDAEFAAYMVRNGAQIDVLRRLGDWDHPTEKEWTAAMQLAQAECARLRARCARLEGALATIISDCDHGHASGCGICSINAARARGAVGEG